MGTTDKATQRIISRREAENLFHQTDGKEGWLDVSPLDERGVGPMTISTGPRLSRNDNGSQFCLECWCLVILFDDDVHDCTGEVIRRGPSR